MVRIWLFTFSLLLTALPAHAQDPFGGGPINVGTVFCDSVEECIRISENASASSIKGAYMEKAADMGSAEAQFKLAKLYEDGLWFRMTYGNRAPHHPIPNQGPLMTYFWYHVASLNNHPGAIEKMEDLEQPRIAPTLRHIALANQMRLAKDLEEDGDLLPQNYELARKTYAKLVLSGKHNLDRLSAGRYDRSLVPLDAYVTYANFLTKGLGGPKDLIGAYKWLSYAAGHNAPLAMDRLYILAQNMTQAEIAEAERQLREGI